MQITVVFTAFLPFLVYEDGFGFGNVKISLTTSKLDFMLPLLTTEGDGLGFSE